MNKLNWNLLETIDLVLTVVQWVLLRHSVLPVYGTEVLEIQIRFFFFPPSFLWWSLHSLGGLLLKRSFEQLTLCNVKVSRIAAPFNRPLSSILMIVSFLMWCLFFCRCVKFLESNHQPQLLFVSVSTIPAKDAAPLEVKMVTSACPCIDSSIMTDLEVTLSWVYPLLFSKVAHWCITYCIQHVWGLGNVILY